jgi:hypothetical protein
VIILSIALHGGERGAMGEERLGGAWWEEKGDYLYIFEKKREVEELRKMVD